MIMSFPRFPLHWRNYEKCISVHFQWFWASLASHSTEEIMKNAFLCIFNDSELPTLPTPPKKSWNVHGNQLFSMILGFPRLPLNRRNNEKPENPCIVNDSGLPTLPLHWRNHYECIEIYAFSMILGFHTLPAPLKKSWKMFRNLLIFNGSGPPTLPTSPKQS